MAPPRRLRTLWRRFSLEEAASTLRHDVRNRLSSIRNAAFYLRRRTVKAAPELIQQDPRVAQFFDLIESELVGAEQVLTSRLPPLPDRVGAPIDAGALIRELAAELAFPAGVTAVAEGSAPVVGDRRELELAVYCLIENAVDAMAGVGGRVIVRARRDDATTVIEVEDEGAGFDEAALGRAFEPFFTTRADRLGLGLNIARRIADRGQGRVEVGPGARARLVLPAEQIDE
jgi:signal transduction histidine kinase